MVAGYHDARCVSLQDVSATSSFASVPANWMQPKSIEFSSSTPVRPRNSEVLQLPAGGGCSSHDPGAATKRLVATRSATRAVTPSIATTSVAVLTREVTTSPTRRPPSPPGSCNPTMRSRPRTEFPPSPHHRSKGASPDHTPHALSALCSVRTNRSRPPAGRSASALCLLLAVRGAHVRPYVGTERCLSRHERYREQDPTGPSGRVPQMRRRPPEARHRPAAEVVLPEMPAGGV